MPDIDMVNHPPHYEPLDGVDFPCIQVARGLTFDIGNAVKYVWRADRKNGRQDLEKARWYLKDAVEHADLVYSGAVTEQFHTNELLQIVALAQTDILRTGFFEAIRLRELPLALHAVNTMIGDVP